MDKVKLTVIRASEEGSSERLAAKLEGRSKMEATDVVDSVTTILKAVEQEGDRAVARYTEYFDGVKLAPEDFRVAPEAIKRAYERLDPAVLEALKKAADNIRRFHVEQKEKGSQSFVTEGPGGGQVGMLVRPLERVGIYVPGGTAPLPSSVLMNAIPAAVAGVKEIVMCTPPQKEGLPDAAILVASDLAGVDRLYQVGGAQAVAAMAYGTENVPAVDKICGPGNIYVNTAKRLVYGLCDIDMFAGPSEILIVADRTAKPEYLAADMLSQAEHDVMASAILITTDESHVSTVQQALAEGYEASHRKEILGQSLNRYAAIVVVADLNQAVELANRLAPEHLELCVAAEKSESLLAQVRHAGAVFLGHYTPEPLGDYFAGPNHVLPTSGTARFFSPLNVGDFQKKMSVIKYDRAALKKVGDSVVRLATAEQLDRHAAAVAIRLQKMEEADVTG